MSRFVCLFISLPCRGGGTRTPNHRFWRPGLYQLSYAPSSEGHTGGGGCRSQIIPGAASGPSLRACVIGPDPCPTLITPRDGPGLRERMSESGLPDLDQRTNALVAAFHRLMMERLEEGLEAIEEVAGSLMRDLAREVGEAAGLGELHERLDAVHAYLGSLGEYLNQRDRALLEWINRKEAEQADHSWIGPVLEETEARMKDSLGGQIDSVHAFVEAGLERLSTVLERRLTELTEQTWTDQLALRRDLMELASEYNRDHMKELDERLGRVTELVSAALGWAVDQIHGHIQRETLRSVEIGMADLVAALDRRFVDLNQAVMDRIDAMDAGLVQRMEGIDGRLTAGLTALEESFAERAGDAVQEAVERRLGPAVDDMARIAAQISVNADAISAAKDELGRGLTRALDDRVAQLARMFRSDNRALADRLEVVEEQAAAKEAIRAVNELAAAIPGEINDAHD